MSFSSSFRLFLPKFPNSSPIFKTLTLSTSPISPPKKLPISKSITIQSIPTRSLPTNSTSQSLPNPNTLQAIEQLPRNLQQIINLFQSVQDPRAKYEQLLFYGKNLKPLDTQFKTDGNKVKGCVSQVWLRAYFDSDDKNVIFEADSDSVLTKGLAALLVQGLSGHTVQEILRVSPDFIVLLGLQQSLTPSRNNGFLNMLKLMQKKAFNLFVENEKGINLDSKIQNPNEKPKLDSKSENPIENSKSNHHDDDADDDDDDDDDEGIELVNKIQNPNEKVKLDSKSKSPIENSKSNHDDLMDDGQLGSRGQRILEILKRGLAPVELEVKDVSYKHAGHAGVRGRNNGETHFDLRVVSGEFEGKSMVKRHRLVYSLLEDELQSGLHALSIDAKTPTEIGS